MTATFLVMASILMVTMVVGAQTLPTDHTVDPELRRVVEDFMKAVDTGDSATVAATYAPDFMNVRVADDGGFVRLRAAQILAMLPPPGAPRTAGPVVPTKDTVIQHAEIIGEKGFVLMTRTKDLGHGWEPLYYSLVWQKQDGKWHLLREFVHQRSGSKPRVPESKP